MGEPFERVKKPVIWYSRMFSHVDGILAWKISLEDQNSLKNLADFGKRDLFTKELVSSHLHPEFLYFGADRKKKASLEDAFVIVGSVPIVSKKMRDVLVDFDIGTTRFLELPVYKNDNKNSVEM